MTTNRNIPRKPAPKPRKNINEVADFLSWLAPITVLLVVFTVVVSSIVALIAMDPITGAITGEYFWGNGGNQEWFVSLAGTGFNIGIGMLLINSYQKKNWRMFTVAIMLFLVGGGTDIYFDGLSVDIYKYGKIVSLADFPPEERLVHALYRMMVMVFSSVGELAAGAALMLFPMLEDFFKKVFKDTIKTSSTPRYQRPRTSATRTGGSQRTRVPVTTPPTTQRRDMRPRPTTNPQRTARTDPRYRNPGQSPRQRSAGHDGGTYQPTPEDLGLSTFERLVPPEKAAELNLGKPEEGHVWVVDIAKPNVFPYQHKLPAEILARFEGNS